MAASDYIEQRVLDLVLRNGAEHSYAGSGTVYVALFTTATSDAGGGTEVANSNAYARTAVTFGAIGAATDGIISNSAEVAFPQASGGAWGTVSHIAIVDSATYGGGEFIYHGALTASKAVDENDTFKIAIGDLDITLS